MWHRTIAIYCHVWEWVMCCHAQTINCQHASHMTCYIPVCLSNSFQCTLYTRSTFSLLEGRSGGTRPPKNLFPALSLLVYINYMYVNIHQSGWICIIIIIVILCLLIISGGRLFSSWRALTLEFCMKLQGGFYSGKLSREKTFTNLAVLEPPAKVFSTKFGRAVPTCDKFWHSAKVSPWNCHFLPIHESFLPRKFPAIQ